MLLQCAHRQRVRYCECAAAKAVIQYVYLRSAAVHETLLVVQLHQSLVQPVMQYSKFYRNVSAYTAALLRCKSCNTIYITALCCESRTLQH
jgi:hypothetical protein